MGAAIGDVADAALEIARRRYTGRIEHLPT